MAFVDALIKLKRSLHKFQDKNKCFLQLLFPVHLILRCISISGVLSSQLLTDILIHSPDENTLAMAWMGNTHMQVETFLSLLKVGFGRALRYRPNLRFFCFFTLVMVLEFVLVTLYV